MLCGEVQNVQTLHRNTHTFARHEITLVLVHAKCKPVTGDNYPIQLKNISPVLAQETKKLK